MVRRIDVALPGPNGIQLRTEQNFGNGVLYDTNGRSEKPLSAAERKMFYEKKLADFLNEGGSLKELNVLSPQSLEQIPSSKSGVSHYEYVERPNGEVWVTEGKAGHLLLAGGGQAQSAGQIVIVKNGKEIALLIASNASGNYKPDLYSVERMALNLSKSLGVPYDRVIVTKGDPLGTQAVSILMKARKIEKALIKEKVSEMEAVATSLINAPSPIFRSSPIIPPDCSLVLSKTNPTHDVK